MTNRHLIFVFGSNLAGMHGAGAALHAVKFCGAQLGIGVGLTGRSYAIPTKDYKIITRPLEHIIHDIEDFKLFAKAHSELVFQVTPIGCGLAGFKQQHIKPLFSGMPNNCFFSAEWEI